MKTLYRTLGAALALVTASGCGRGGGGPSLPATQTVSAETGVGVITARVDTVTRSIPVTGSLASLQDVTLSAKLAGRVVQVPVREGDSVTAGQVLVQLDTTDLRSQARSAAAAVSAAEARLAQAKAAYQQQVVSTNTGIQSAEAGLRSAQAELSQVRDGARRQEIAQQEAQVAIARTNLKKAEADLRRYEMLLAQGAVAVIQVDQYRATRDVAQEQLRAAEQQLSLLRAGARTQQVEQAEQAVRQAEETLRQARAGRAQNQVRQAEVEADRAAVRQARNTLAIAQQAIRDATTRAPFNGQVAARSVDPGQVVAAGASLIRLVSLDTVYFIATVPDIAIREIREGQPVSVQVDAFPRRSFAGKISSIYPAASTTSRAFSVRVTIPNPNRELRPGVYARGQIEIERHANVVLVPRGAVVRKDIGGTTRDVVFTVENGTARQHVVTLGLPTPDGRWVEADGVPRGAQVVIVGQNGITEGERVAATPISRERFDAIR